MSMLMRLVDSPGMEVATGLGKLPGMLRATAESAALVPGQTMLAPHLTGLCRAQKSEVAALLLTQKENSKLLLNAQGASLLNYQD